MRKNTQWYYRWAPSLGGGFSGTPEKVWGVKKYNPKKHFNEPTVFCGLYGLPDFMAFRQHKGEKMIWYAGSDIRHLIAGYWIDEVGKIRVDPKPFCKYLSKYENYVENKVEYDALKKWGIEAKIVPSFLGDVNDFQISYKWDKRPKVYSSVSGDDFELYQWPVIEEIALENPDIDFYLYGNKKDWFPSRGDFISNIFVRGRISQKQMDAEIKNMQGALRLLSFDGFSEIVAKSILWGQYPISTIKYPHMLSIEKIRELKKKKEPNIKGRDYYLKILNKYPWNYGK